MKKMHLLKNACLIMALLCLISIAADAETYEKASLAQIDQYDARLVEVSGIPLVSTFKEEDGFGVWNLLIGQDDLKLLCYEEGASLDGLGDAHKVMQGIIDKNEDFKKEGQVVQSVTVRGQYDGANEILSLDEIEYDEGGNLHRILTDSGNKAQGTDQEQAAEQVDRPAETYIIFHEVGQPWLYAPAWCHYPAWWGGYWVDVHWWWRPWHDCNLGWYVDHYCYDMHSCHHHDPCNYGDGQGGYSQDYGRRRGIYRDAEARTHETAYRSEKRYRQHDGTPRMSSGPGKGDVSREMRAHQKTYREAQPYTKSYRSSISHSQPTRQSQPARMQSRSSSGHQPSRSFSAPAPSHSTPKPTRSRR